MTCSWVGSLCAFALVTLTACDSGDCNCSPGEDLPPEVDDFALVEPTRYDEDGNAAPLLIDPTGGTMRTVGNEVRITYQLDGIEYEVFYEVADDG